MPFFQSVTSFFTGAPPPTSASRHQARRNVMNNTMDAFSLPTTRYAGAGSSAPGEDSTPSSPGPSRRQSTTNFTSYPTPRNANSIYQPAPTSYPPLSNTFHRLREAMSGTFPELLETMNEGVDPDLLSSFEAELGCPLPPAVRDSFAVADGQDLESAYQLPNGGLFYGLHLLPLEEVMREWAFWRQAEHDPMAGQNAAVLATMAAVPPGWIKSVYACRGWIPLLSDRAGNYVGVDLDPGQGGSWGQVLVFGRDFDRKCVLWKGEGEGGWGKWLATLVDELESGEGWEADKSNSSDEDDEVGYTSYTGNQSYGEEGKGMRLAGEYRGWNVLEAWWDKSVRRWETMGLGLDVEEVEKGLKEARRLAGYDEEEAAQEGKGKGRDPGERAGLGIGMGLGSGSAQVEIPVLGSPQIPQPGTPMTGDSDILLPPASPDIHINRVHSPTPTRVITPLPTNDHPLSHTDDRGFLSPPTRSPKRNNRSTRPRSNMPAPTSLDLPTRADVQAMAAIHHAESSGLRGGWVMNLDTTGNARRGAGGRQPEDEMEDIDLEGGRTEKFGNVPYTDREMARQRDEEKLAMAGLEHRRASPGLEQQQRRASPSLLHSAGGTRSPSPLSRPTSPDTGSDEPTPRASAARENIISPHPSVLAATNKLRRPPPIASPVDPMMRSWSNDDEPGRAQGSRPSSMARSPRTERESSVTSDVGLLDHGSSLSNSQSRAGSPPIMFTPIQSPAQMFSPDIPTMGSSYRPGSSSARSSVSFGMEQERSVPGIRLVGASGSPVVRSERRTGVEDAMEEISLEEVKV